jgi:hypothetical protein
MSSQRKLHSSKANGALSRGPVTPAGKDASARNSLRHGMIAKTIVLDGESEERFLALIEALTEEYKPSTEAQRALLDIMAAAQWRLLRTWSIQKADFNREMARHQGPAPMRASVAFRDLCDNSRSMDLIHRYETSYDRQFSRALRNLLALQAAQAGDQPETSLSIAITGATWADVPAEVPPAIEKVILRNERGLSP